MLISFFANSIQRQLLDLVTVVFTEVSFSGQQAKQLSYEVGLVRLVIMIVVGVKDATDFSGTHSDKILVVLMSKVMY